MKVIVKYQFLDSSNLTYGMFDENGVMIENTWITDRKVPLGGIASNVRWLEKDVHSFTSGIKDRFPNVTEIDYQLFECDCLTW
jgi:hypothetical protein